MSEFITYRHTKYARCVFGPYEFVDHLCRIPLNEEDRFVDFMSKQPAVERARIVRVDEAAIAAAQRPLGSQVVRGGHTEGSSADSVMARAKALASLSPEEQAAIREIREKAAADLASLPENPESEVMQEPEKAETKKPAADAATLAAAKLAARK